MNGQPQLIDQFLIEKQRRELSSAKEPDVLAWGILQVPRFSDEVTGNELGIFCSDDFRPITMVSIRLKKSDSP